MHRVPFLVLVISLAGAACAHRPRTVGDRTPYAQRLEQRQCGDGTPTLRARVVEAMAFDRVEPIYNPDWSVKLAPSRLLVGARLRARHAAPESPSSLQNTLECHEADLATGKATIDDDPFITAEGGWVDISVRTDEGDTIVELRAVALRDAEPLFDRARRFVAAARPTTK